MSSRTLIVGQSQRVGVTSMSPQDLDRLEGQFAEIIIELPLEELSDAVSILQKVHAHADEDAVLTVFGSSSIVPRLVQQGGFRPFRTDKAGKRERMRARAIRRQSLPRTCSVIVPCRNELENIEPLVNRLPDLGSGTELLFVDGASTDGTPERIERVIQANPGRDIRLLRQNEGRGKGDAVFQGFDAATGDILMILDADMAVAPEDLPNFYQPLAEGLARFANGTRFVFTMESGAMPAVNHAGNKAFGRVFSWLVDQKVTDTLCGTKALFREDWLRLRQIRPLFGNHDPWGDFDLLLGAAYLGLTLIEVPVPYHARVAGASKMRAFQDGPTLLRTVGYGVARLKFGFGRNQYPEA